MKEPATLTLIGCEGRRARRDDGQERAAGFACFRVWLGKIPHVYLKLLTNEFQLVNSSFLL